jgi:hypothetical protein
MASSGIESATILLVAYCLNQLCYRVSSGIHGFLFYLTLLLQLQKLNIERGGGRLLMMNLEGFEKICHRLVNVLIASFDWNG